MFDCLAPFVPPVRLSKETSKISHYTHKFFTRSIRQDSTSCKITLQKLQLLNKNRFQSTASHLFARTRSVHAQPKPALVHLSKVLPVRGHGCMTTTKVVEP